MLLVCQGSFYLAMCMTKLLGSVEIFSLAVCLLATLFHSHPVGQIGIFSSKGAQVHTGSTRSVKAGKDSERNRGVVSEIVLLLPVASFIFLHFFCLIRNKLILV